MDLVRFVFGGNIDVWTSSDLDSVGNMGVWTSSDLDSVGNVVVWISTDLDSVGNIVVSTSSDLVSPETCLHSPHASLYCLIQQPAKGCLFFHNDLFFIFY